MSELSTLSTSPTALGDPHAAPSISATSSALPAPLESTRDAAVPKSSLYGEKALTGTSPAAPPGDCNASPSTLTADNSPPSASPDASPPEKQPPLEDAETGNHLNPQEARATDLAFLEKPPPSGAAQSQAQPASPSPELNPGPNLYPSVHVTHNPNPAADPGPLVPDQPQIVPVSDLTPPPQVSPSEEDKPQPPQQAQAPESQPRPQAQPPPLSPKPNTPSVVRKPELPATPTRAEHPSPVPLIHEPLATFPVPNPSPRPAPDTLSYLESASLMSGTLESLSGLGEDGSSVGSDSEINGLAVRRTDKYGFLGGSQYSEGG